MLRVNSVKDECGYSAVFAEQGASASQMAAAKFLDVTSKLSGEASDAASEYFHDKSPKSWDKIDDPVVPLERNLYGHPLAGLLCDRKFEVLF